MLHASFSRYHGDTNFCGLGKHGSRVRAVFLHAVSGCKDSSVCNVPADRIVEGVPFFYFKTYVGAAAKAVQHGLLERNGLQRVVKAAVEDLETKNPIQSISDVPLKKNWLQKLAVSDSDKATQWYDLQKDIAFAEAVTSSLSQRNVLQLLSPRY